MPVNQAIGFCENKGQVSDQYYQPRPDVLFSGHVGDLVFHLRQNGISYQLNQFTSPPAKEQTGPDRFTGIRVPDVANIHRIDINWLNINNKARILKEQALPGYSNYYSATCPNGALQVKTYGQLTYQQLYNGIDLVWYTKNGHLKYDYLVAAGADYTQIVFEIEGAQKISVTKTGALSIKTPLGNLQEDAPYVEQNGKQLAAKWIVNNNRVSFQIKNIDHSQAFTIDPMLWLWGTYFGGALRDSPGNVTTDASGNVFFCGETRSSTNIATVGAAQSTYGGFGYYGDAFLAKFDPNGMPIWVTYYGGPNSDFANFCCVDANGNAYIAGGTSCTISAVIATPGAFQTAYTNSPINTGATADAFMAKFDGSGARLWGTYYGGNGYEWAYWTSLDNFGNVYMCGATSSTNSAMVTPGCFQATAGTANDGFLVQFNTSGQRQWGTYYGSTGFDEVYSVNPDAAGNVYITGITNTSSGTALTTPGCYQPTYGGGLYDGFLAKFTMAGARLWGTYYGGTGDDYFYYTIHGNNVFYAVGTTSSANGIATPGTHQPVFGGNQDMYLVAFDASGARQWGTYYGGTAIDGSGTAVLDAAGNIYVSGGTATTTGTVIATPCTYQDVYGGGSWDAYLVKFSPAGTRIWGTYYGSAGQEDWSCMAMDASGNIYLYGLISTAGTALATPGAYQSSWAGYPSDCFLAKLSPCLTPAPPNTTPPPNLQICYGNSTTLTTSLTCNINWYSSLSSSTPLGSGSSFTTPALPFNTTYYVDELSCGITSTRTAIEVTVTPLPVISINSPSVICSGQTATLTANGANSYTWSAGASPVNGGTTIVAPQVNSSYSVVGSDNGCQGSGSITVMVVTTPTPLIYGGSLNACQGSSIALSVSGADSYAWQPAAILSQNTGASVIALPTTNTIFTVTGTNASNGINCSAQSTLGIFVLPYADAAVSPSLTICEGGSAILSASGGNIYNWEPESSIIDPNISSVIVSPTVTTVYTVNVSTGGACGSQRTVMVLVNPKPLLNAGRDTIFNLKEPMMIDAIGTGTITWIEGEDILCKTCPDTQVFPIRKTCYTAQAINDFGCTATDQVCIDVGLEYNAYIPNSFTPNNDGLNDVFYIKGFGISDISMTIYNRWGDQLYATSGNNSSWNGTYKGQLCLPGTYVYKIAYTAANGKRQYETGHVNLLK